MIFLQTETFKSPDWLWNSLIAWKNDPNKHTTSFQRCNNVVDVQTTMYQRQNDVVDVQTTMCRRQNDVVCLLGLILE